MYRRLSDIFKSGAVVIFYEAGREAGRSYGKFLKDKMGDPERMTETLRRLTAAAGWGKFALPALSFVALPKKMIMKVKNNFHAEAVGQTGESSCHFIRGLLVGVFEAVVGKEFVCNEAGYFIGPGSSWRAQRPFSLTL